MAIDQKKVNVVVAKIVPLVLVAIVAYASWVIVAEVCVNYLINPPAASSRNSRPGAATAILVVYFIILVFVASAYFRTLYAIAVNPGYVPQGSEHHKKNRHRKSRKSRAEGHNSKSSEASDVEKVAGVSGYPGGYTYTGAGADAPSDPPSGRPGLEEFYDKDIFECGGDGMPRWCSTCTNWKPDRAHHCREVGRCVRKMDHYCPWVGGIVSETNFKFFIQFITFTTVFCTFILVITAVIMAEMQREGQTLNVHHIVVACLSGLFFIFAAGMTGSSIDLALRNSTSIENLSRAKVWSLAVYLSNPPEPTTKHNFQTVKLEGPGLNSLPRIFAILHSRPGENPYDLGQLDNFKSVMGDRWMDWLLPWRSSPCCDHSGESAFVLGPVVQRMKEEAGIIPRERKKKRRRKDKGKQRGTPPPEDLTIGSNDRSVGDAEEDFDR